jgi:hypothetical protein
MIKNSDTITCQKESWTVYSRLDNFEFQKDDRKHFRTSQKFFSTDMMSYLHPVEEEELENNTLDVVLSLYPRLKLKILKKTKPRKITEKHLPVSKIDLKRLRVVNLILHEVDRKRIAKAIVSQGFQRKLVGTPTI